jgi:RHS repeat-associated protein
MKKKNIQYNIEKKFIPFLLGAATRKITLLIICTSFVFGGLNAQPPPPPDPGGGDIPIPVPGSSVVGTLPGNFSISPSGAATYAIPIDLPPGRAGMTPSIALSYNSQGGNGLLGMGWSISGLSSITRTGTTLYHNGVIDGVDFDGNDQYMLDGNRLMQVGYSEYRTELETYSKIETHGLAGSGPEWFEVYAKNGMIMEYGKTDDSRIEATERDDVLFWNLNRISDRNGNFIDFTYSEHNGYGKIAKIEYTGNSETLDSPDYSVNFQYITGRNDIIKNYISGSSVEIDVQLAAVEIRYYQDELMVYELNYNNPGDAYTHLLNVQLTNDGKVLNPSVFEWGDEAQQFTLSTTNIQNTTYSADYTMGDFNGDGKTDVVCAFYNYNQGVKVFHDWSIYFSNYDGTSFSERYMGDLNVPLDGIFSHFVSGDFNGDGFDDLVMFRKLNNGLYTNLYKFSYGASFGIFIPGFQHQVTEDHYFRTGDLNGNGITEFILVTESQDNKTGINTTSIFAYEYEGNGNYKSLFTNSPSTGGYSWQHTSSDLYKLKTGDFNGDGATDLLVNTNELESKIFTLNVEQEQLWTLTPLGLGYPNKFHRVFTGDFNGDKITDVLTFAYADPNVNWELSLFDGRDGWVSVDCPITRGHDPAASNSDNHYIVSDYNGDGKSDILEVFDRQEGVVILGSYFNTYYSNGKDFKYETDFFDDFSPFFNHFYPHFDFNGDGNSDCLLLDYWDDPKKVMFFHKNEQHDLIQKVSNGHGVQSEIIYKPLTDSMVYERGNGYDYPISYTQLPLHVVYSIIPDEDLGQNIQTEYFYKRAKIHKHGKGFLGFEETVVTNHLSNTIVNNEFEIFTKEIDQKEMYFHPYLKKSTTKILSGNQLSYAENIMDVKENTENSFIYYPVTTASLSKSWDLDGSFIKTNKSTQELYQIDDYGNSIYSLVLTDPDNLNITSSNNEFDFKKEFSAIYSANIDVDNWLISRPGLLIEFNYLKDDPSAFGSYTELTYYAENESQSDGVQPWPSLKSTRIAPEYGWTHELTTQVQFEYDQYGNNCKEILSAPNAGPALDDRVTLYEYESNNGYDARFLTQATKTLNGVNYETTYDYYPDKGKLKYETDPAGLITAYYYDDFGKPRVTVYPDRTNLRTAYTWSLGDENNPEGGLFKVTKIFSDEAPVTTYYDKFERELRYVSYGLNGNEIIFSDKEYNNKGLLEKAYAPYFSSDTRDNYTEFIYDEIGRVENKITPVNTITYTYSGRTTSSTNLGTGVTNSKTVDVLGNPVSITDPTGTIYYEYYSSGNVKSIEALGSVTSMKYDDAGNQTELNDPNAGLTTYAYNAFGELKSQRDARNVLFQMDYDNFGRITEKTCVNSREITWYWYNDDINENGFGKIREIMSEYDGGITYTYSYDDFDRLSSKTETIEGNDYTTEYEYNRRNGRLERMEYPSGFAVKYNYTPTGDLFNVIQDDATELVIWEAVSKNHFGQLTEYELGNGLTTTKDFDEFGYPENIITGTVQDLSYVFNVQTGNLTSRADDRFNLSESFGYDTQLKTRLTSWQVNGQQEYTAHIQSNGNILTKTDVTYQNGPLSVYRYTNAGPHAVTEILNPNPDYQNAAYPLDIHYTVFNKADRIEQIINDDPNGAPVEHVLTIDYGPDEMRKKTQYSVDGVVNKTKYFIGSQYEIELDAYGNERKLHYISGGDGVSAIYEMNSNGTNNMYYVQKDYLGSYYSITDENGQLVIINGREEQVYSFDPWGRRRHPQSWNYYTYPTTYLFDRGFTGHEHLDDFKMINMNARLYEPRLGRFLQPDPFVQAPTYSQSYNRYSYAWNNPLKYTDPSGAIVGEIIAFAAFTYLMNAHANRDEDGNWAWNPLDWFGEGSNTYIVAGVNTNTSGTNLTGYVGAGTNNMIPSMAYNNNQGFGFGVSNSSGNSSFYYPTYNYYAPEQNGYQVIDDVRQAYGEEAYAHSNGIVPVIGIAGSIAGELYYSKTFGTWMGRNFKIYQQTWGGNGYIGGKNKFGKTTSNYIKWGGRILGVYNGYKTISERIDGEVGTVEMLTELGSTGVSNYGGTYGAAWGVGWELGRILTTSSAYQEFKFHFWYDRMEKRIGPPSQINEDSWYYFLKNYGK